MKQTVATYETANPAGIEHGTIHMRACVERASEDGLLDNPPTWETPWRATLESTDYCHEVGWFATQDGAAEAAVAAARKDDAIGQVTCEPYFAQA